MVHVVLTCPLWNNPADPPDAVPEDQYSASPNGVALEIGQWLRSFGLDRYEAAFLENDITVEVLTELTTDDLKELGVASIGHRRRLMAAIAALRDSGALPLRARA